MPARARRARADAIRRSRDGKSWERRKARTATTEKPVCETRAAGAGAPPDRQPYSVSKTRARLHRCRGVAVPDRYRSCAPGALLANCKERLTDRS